MAPFIVPLDSKTAELVQISKTQATGTIIPTLALGEVLRVGVKSNLSTGQGTLEFGSLLINAKLPPELLAGDILLAKVSESGKNLVLKILEINRPVIPGTTAQIVQELEHLLKESSPAFLRSLTPTFLPGTDATGTNNLLSSLTNSIKDLSQLLEPNEVLKSFVSLERGDTTRALEDYITSLKTFFGTTTPSPSERLVNSLFLRLSEILGHPQDDFQEQKKTVAFLASTLEKELLSERSLDTKTRSVLNSILRDLQKSLLNTQSYLPLLESAREQLFEHSLLPKTGNTTLDLKSAVVQQALTQLEQMAQAQTKLQQLNPLMQALGEPAFFLFPFLFQGFLAQSEIAVDPKAKKKDSQEKQQKKSKKQLSSTPFTRVQVSTPCPHLGTVEVDITHRESEIYVRFTVADEEVGKFILEHLEYLLALLRKLGFEKAELTASVEKTKDLRPHWVIGLEASISTVA